MEGVTHRGDFRCHSAACMAISGLISFHLTAPSPLHVAVCLGQTSECIQIACKVVCVVSLCLTLVAS